ncbi:MAG TPA: hypothetical protein GXX35_10720 [Thermoanaerobacterales bacterium]|nr:hypothetical protein [Thermoanaerobacterales bacterium]
MATLRYELHRIVDLLDEDDAIHVLEILKKLIKKNNDDTILTPDEIKRMEEGEAQIARGEYVDFEDIKKEYGL